MDLPGATSALQTAESAMTPYQSMELPTMINKNITEQWSPALQKSTGVTQNLMSEFLPKFFNIANTGLTGGTTAADLAPSQKLTQMGTELGTMGGELAAASAYSDYLGGQMADMQNRALQALQYGNQAAADAYNRVFQRYQLAFQAAEEEKNRALQKQLATQAFTNNNNDQPVPTPTIDTGDTEEGLVFNKKTNIWESPDVTALQGFKYNLNTKDQVLNALSKAANYGSTGTPYGSLMSTVYKPLASKYVDTTKKNFGKVGNFFGI